MIGGEMYVRVMQETNRWLAVLGFFALSLAFAGATLATPQDVESRLKTYVGIIYLLRGEGNHAEVRISRAALGIYRGQCDVAIEITRAEFATSGIQFDAVIVGTVQLAGHNTIVCPNFPAALKIFMAGFTRQETPQNLAAAIDKELLQPDAYLASYNITISAARTSPGDMETPLAQPGTVGLSPPKPLLSVNAAYTDAVRRARLNGIVTVQATVGRDGHLYSGTVLNALDPAIDQRVLSLLPLWRLQPARVDEDPVAFQVSLATTFNLH